MRARFLTPLLFFFAATFAQNQKPNIINFSAEEASGAVTINYQFTDAENDAAEVRLLISSDGGETFLEKAGTLSGDVGYPITPGTNKQIVWNYDTLSNVYSCIFRLVVDDRQAPDIQQIVNSVDSLSLLADLEYVQGIRHYQANPTHLENVKDFIEQRMSGAGLSVARQDFMQSGYTGQNIIGKKAGLGSEDSTYIIDAHFDSVDDAPGADDNGSGVVGVLEALRVLAPYNFQKTIRFIGFDFEEAGLKGSIKYVQSGIPAYEKIKGVFNYEMIGYYSDAPNSQQLPAGFNLLFPDQYNTVSADSFRGNFIVNVGDDDAPILNKAFDSLATVYVPALKKVSLVLPGNGTIASDFRRSDHAPFWDSGVPALMLTDGAEYRNTNYHSPADSLTKLNFTFMSNVVKATVATVATLAGIQHSSFTDAMAYPAGIAETNVHCKSTISPNPVSSHLNIRAGDCFANGFSFKLIDIHGRIVANKMVEKNEEEINLQQLPKGVYFAILESDGNRAVQRVVKD